MAALSTAIIENAKGAVTLALGLVGVMALFLGLMKIAEAGGLLVVIARLVRPLMQRLFPQVPPDHPAMGAMIMNMAANILGLGNAATPFGIKAMQALQSLNPVPGTATNAMALFLAINTSSVTLLPTGVIGLRAAAGSADPAAIVPTTLFATICSTTVAILMAKFLQRFWPMPTEIPKTDLERSSMNPAADEPSTSTDSDLPPVETAAYPIWVGLLTVGCVIALIPLTLAYGRTIAPWIIPLLVFGFLTYGVVKKVPIYETLVEGAKEGFEVALRIIPYLVAILVAVGMFRASGAMDLIIQPLGAITGPLGMPADALPMALLRPLSGSGAYGILAATINDPAIGPDSYTGILVSTIQGSTETTFYVLTVYFGAVGIKRVRHALIAALTADLAGVIGAIISCSILYGN
jgi:spore maturation protein SpmA